MKKIICSLLCSVIFGTAASAMNIPNKVEISFAIGESVLSINGNEIEVDTPFVVNGTTLVPLRVITEAFGSEVVWNGTNKTIDITYPNINIKLEINSKTAYINNEPIRMLEAPLVTENDRTMVPLRFISEAFGAAVDYDDNNKGITVTLLNESVDDYDGVQFSDEDFADFVEAKSVALNRFEKHFLPQRVFNYHNEADLIWKEQAESPFAFVNVAWEMALDEQISEIMYSGYGYSTEGEAINENIYDEETGYYIPDTEYPAFFDYTVKKAGFTADEVMHVSDVVVLANDYSYVLIEMSDASDIDSCKFIAIVTSKTKPAYRYFTSEVSIDGTYNLCEISNPVQHKKIKTITGTEQSFLNGVKDTLGL